jgi:hypothetical protein
MNTLTSSPVSSQLNKLLVNIGMALDITEAQYNTVIERYTAVGNHLCKDDSPLKRFSPEIKPQGSFLFGTMIRPIIEDDELDVDLVCRLKGKLYNWTQYDVKKAVGDQLKDNADYKRMLDEEGNRCWTLVYHEASKFHMDVLPAVIEENQLLLLEKSLRNMTTAEVEQLAINITDKRRHDYRSEIISGKWLKSNPWGYAAWLKDRANLDLYKSLSIKEAVEQLPTYRTDKEILLRVIQILKRHRDIMFGGDECKPISIIITTLAAKAYNKETDLVIAINNIMANMELYISPKFSKEHNKNVKWISNPVNECENFADRWILETEREQRFYDWLDKAKSDFAYLKTCDTTQAYRFLKEILGTRAVNEAISEMGLSKIISESYQPVNYLPSLLTVAHREKPRWFLNLRYKVEVHGRYRTPEGKQFSITTRTTIPKKCDIYFVAETNVPRPFDVYWQVVNNGDEANRVGGLRGGIFHSQTAGKGGLNQKEHSAYKGLHWVECFIVKDGICAARSYEFFVNIG